MRNLTILFSNFQRSNYNNVPAAAHQCLNASTDDESEWLRFLAQRHRRSDPTFFPLKRTSRQRSARCEPKHRGLRLPARFPPNPIRFQPALKVLKPGRNHPSSLTYKQVDNPAASFCNRARHSRSGWMVCPSLLRLFLT